ncbi:conserved hypothetical protein [Ricinus communis]|uniref:Non-haem dioxygenase N-terminal domain-containing protein n=1 Tax=Ricinus communis TaxID=3988 RepID=B9RVB5_RICCO|nr:conserved hypothetical protein [Ricinus communis]
MAGIPAEVLLSERVQEIVLHASLIPIIDISLLSSSESSTEQDELQKLISALCSWGCSQAMGHGIPETLLDKIPQATMEFFEQRLWQKRKRYAKGVEEFEGYGADRLFHNVYPEDQRKQKLSPEHQKSFRQFSPPFHTLVVEERAFYMFRYLLSRTQHL